MFFYFLRVNAFCAQGDQKTALDTLGLDLEMVSSYHVGAGN